MSCPFQEITDFTLKKFLRIRILREFGESKDFPSSKFDPATAVNHLLYKMTNRLIFVKFHKERHCDRVDVCLVTYSQKSAHSQIHRIQ